MASRSLILNDGSVFTYYNLSSASEVSFKIANIDGTDKFGKTDLRATGPNEDEVVLGATIMDNGLLRIFFSTSQNGGNVETRYADYNASTGAAIGNETVTDILYTFPNGTDTFVLDLFPGPPRTNDLLTLADGSMVFEQYGTVWIWDANSTLVSVASTEDYPHTSTFAQVGNQLLVVKGDIQAAINGNPVTDGVTTAELFALNGEITLPAGPSFVVDEGDHSINANFGAGLNGLDSVELSDGRFVIAYSDRLIVNQQVTDDKQSVWLKIYNADGTVDRPEYLGSTNSDDGDTIDPVLYALYDGGFALVFNTVLGLPQVDRTEVRVFDESGDQRDSYVIQATSLDYADDIYVSPDGAVWVYSDEVTVKEHQFTVDGGPAPVGIVLDGDDTDEILEGTAFDDEINGKKGNDTIDGLEGKDRLKGGLGDDTLNGGDQADILEGGAGKDVLNGGRGTDKLIGGKQADVLNGQQGTDKLLGGNGSDNLRGGSGKDKLYGEAGNDKLHGGQGADQFVFSTGDGKDKIVDFADGQDEIVILSGANSFADLTITANGGDAKVSFSNVEITLKGIDNSDLSSDDLVFGL
ncbi:calcium-binding protein [Algirhabdus cladophorae]|uniref:calcium-binding protein n=1 Tax=Algirhabdus cladophorae TaxID=3377108 RepID=UPI003B845F55